MSCSLTLDDSSGGGFLVLLVWIILSEAGVSIFWSGKSFWMWAFCSSAVDSHSEGGCFILLVWIILELGFLGLDNPPGDVGVLLSWSE